MLLSFYQTGNPLRKHILCLIPLYSQYGNEPYPYVSMLVCFVYTELERFYYLPVTNEDTEGQSVACSQSH